MSLSQELDKIANSIQKESASIPNVQFINQAAEAFTRYLIGYKIKALADLKILSSHTLIIEEAGGSAEEANEFFDALYHNIIMAIKKTVNSYRD